MARRSTTIQFARSKPDQRAQQLMELSRNSRKAAAVIMRMQNVVAVTIGEKLVGGRPAGELSLVAQVTRKGGKVASSELIPRVVDLPTRSGSRQLPTDVCEVRGVPRALGARSGDTIWSADGDYGTSCLTFVRNGKGYVATNAHVVANVAQGRYYLPNVMQPAGSEAIRLDSVAYMSPFGSGRAAREDLAIIATTARNVSPLGMVGETAPIARIDAFVSSIREPYWYNVNGMRVMLGEPQPSPAGLPIPMLIDGIWYPYANFWMLAVTAGQVEHGHSGAVICRGGGDDISACGILFGGVLPSIAYAFQLQPRFRTAYNLLP